MQTWDIVNRTVHSLRYYPNGKIAGFDLLTILSLSDALGYDTKALLWLIGYAETGLHQAVTDHGDSKPEHHD